MQWSGALPPRTEQLSTLIDGTHTGGRDSRLQHLDTPSLLTRTQASLSTPLSPFLDYYFFLHAAADSETYEGLQGT